ncbi:MAG: hypothetical protein LBP40_05730, partial [Campylobacteraceae bacterium]|nr:hypothetical protein [Campylobacteraceae bacterium]
DILKDSAYRLTQFSDEQIQNIEKEVIVRNAKDKETYHIVCPNRKSTNFAIPAPSPVILHEDA